VSSPDAAARGAGRRARFPVAPLAGDERQLAFVWGLLAVSSLALRPFWLAMAPLLPACPFRALTGLPCLSCGTTRTAVALLGGRPLDALATNPLAAAAGIAFIVGGLVAPIWAALRLPVPRLAVRPTRSLRLALVLLLLADWAWLIARR
jgi:hypothetical protein